MSNYLSFGLSSLDLRHSCLSTWCSLRIATPAVSIVSASALVDTWWLICYALRVFETDEEQPIQISPHAFHPASRIQGSNIPGTYIYVFGTVHCGGVLHQLPYATPLILVSIMQMPYDFQVPPRSRLQRPEVATSFPSSSPS